MNDSFNETAGAMPTDSVANWSEAFARRAVLGLLKHLRAGKITFVEGNTRTHFEGTEPMDASAEIRVAHPRFWRAILTGGSIGAGEAYMDGLWSCDDLTALVRIIVRNRAVLDKMEKGFARVTLPFTKLYHLLRPNTRTGSKRNIAAHYDLGNDFFKLFLDETMMYSSAVFEHDAATLREASEAKLERICRKLDLKPTDHLVEIGTGWGGFALHAAARHGCRVTTTTISREQHDLAQARVREAGLQDRIEIVMRDYRDLTGQYDKLVSIEMIEAVGHKFLPGYFRKCSDLLKPDGIGVIQAITIADQHYDRYRREVDFIQRYIFPGGCLPSVAVMGQCIAQETDMRLFHLEELAPHYARTLAEWRTRFMAALPRVSAMGFPPSFIRMWEFYLCYCEGAFHERFTGLSQLVMTKPLCRRSPVN